MHRAEGGGVQVVGQCARIVPYLMVPVSLLTKIDCMQFLGSCPCLVSLSTAQEWREREILEADPPAPLGCRVVPTKATRWRSVAPVIATTATAEPSQISNMAEKTRLMFMKQNKKKAKADSKNCHVKTVLTSSLSLVSAWPMP